MKFYSGPPSDHFDGEHFFNPSHGRPLGADPLIRQQLADLYGRVLVHQAISQRVLTIAADDGPPGPVADRGPGQARARVGTGVPGAGPLTRLRTRE